MRKSSTASRGAAPPLRCVLTATGNVYEDVVHGLAVAQAGGDIVAVIRSTAQSLLDYVPYGPTTVFGLSKSHCLVTPPKNRAARTSERRNDSTVRSKTSSAHIARE